MWLIYDSIIMTLPLALILSSKWNKSKENEKKMLNKEASIQTLHVWQLLLYIHWVVTQNFIELMKNIVFSSWID